jgi:hypothetical protein
MVSVRAERSVGSEQAVRLLEVGRDPGRHTLVGGVGVLVAEVRGGLFGYPPKKLHGFGERAGCLPHRSDRMLDGVRLGRVGQPTTLGIAHCASADEQRQDVVSELNPAIDLRMKLGVHFRTV